MIVPDRIAVQVDGFSVFGGRRVASRADPGPLGAPLVLLRVQPRRRRQGREAARASEALRLLPRKSGEATCGLLALMLCENTRRVLGAREREARSQ